MSNEIGGIHETGQNAGVTFQEKDSLKKDIDDLKSGLEEIKFKVLFKLDHSSNRNNFNFHHFLLIYFLVFEFDFTRSSSLFFDPPVP